MQPRHRLLVINLEPTPYKVDLYNAFSDCKEWDLFVFHSQTQDWSPDAGHNFRELPVSRFPSDTVEGNGLLAGLVGFLKLLNQFGRLNPDFTLVCGYARVIPLLAIAFLALTRRKYALWADQFNTDSPRRGGIIASIARGLARQMVFKTASMILVCGREGCASAIEAGCPQCKIVDFPYSVDAQRLAASKPNAVPAECMEDVGAGKTVIMFSGRHIPRKGLPTLLQAISVMPNKEAWVLWVEGDGPDRREYETMAKHLKIANQCRFLGFCQMNLHGWLLNHADIVVIPSTYDPWGIVVEEGMMLGKCVCASNATGSALDRIKHKENGYLFEPGNSDMLAQLLSSLIFTPHLREQISKSAEEAAKKWSPRRNVEVFSQAFYAIYEKSRQSSN